MAQNMKDVIEITIPQGSVKKIEDSNGNIIWGSQSAFPYRRLEYIQSTGKQAFDTGVAANRTHYLLLYVADMNTADAPQGRGNVVTNGRFGAGYRKNANNQRVFRYGLGSGWVDGPTASTGMHKIGVQGPACTMWSINQLGYYYDGTFVSSSNSYNNGSSWPTLFLLGSRGNAAGSIQEPCYCKMYYAEYGHTSGGTIVKDRRYYPVQRKSDGKLGFYDTVNNTFLNELVSASESNTLVAGPVVDEYWNLQNVTIS